MFAKMNTIKIKNYFEKSRKEKFAIGQFNISNFECFKAITQGALNLKSPVIIGTSEGESKFLGLRQIAAIVRSFREETGLPVFLNLDHGKTFEYIKEAADSGYDAVHFDGSRLPLSENIEITKKVAEYCHKKGIFVEGEVGIISGASEIHKEKIEISEADLTGPEDALKFVKETKVESLAVNIGNFHGMEVSGFKPHLNLQRLKEIKEKIGNNAFLVLHGGSGIPEEDIKEAIIEGIRKININTELRISFTNALKEALQKNPEENTPYKYLPETINAVRKIVEEKIRTFGSANKI